ncbi:hypothetical protein [Actinacidiphila acididurans]|uniref:hypothetical protein n=1 Tax=Actinacidiphila acididurans TaxID=2784346 RepID=UPI00355600B4
MSAAQGIDDDLDGMSFLDLVDDPATDAVAHLHRLRGLLLEQRGHAAATVTAIDRELEALVMGIRTTPEVQLKVLGAPRTAYERRGQPVRLTKTTNATTLCA